MYDEDELKEKRMNTEELRRCAHERALRSVINFLDDHAPEQALIAVKVAEKLSWMMNTTQDVPALSSASAASAASNSDTVVG